MFGVYDNNGYDGTYENILPEGGMVFSNLPIASSPQTASSPNKPRNPLTSMSSEFGDRKIWSVQHWRFTEDGSTATLSVDMVYNGLTYKQAVDKRAEILASGDASLSSVEILIKMGM